MLDKKHARNHTNGRTPAYPAGLVQTTETSGLSKRELIAAMCLQGILANKSIGKLTLWSTTQSAVMYADELLDRLEQDPGTGSGLTSNEKLAATIAFSGVPKPSIPDPTEAKQVATTPN